MDPFPDEHELVELFGGLPEVTDRDVPWCYNHLKFVIENAGDHVVFETYPGYGEAEIRWHQESRLVASLSLGSVTGMKVELGGDKRTLVLLFDRESPVHPLRLQIAPVVHLVWGVSELRAFQPGRS